MDPASITIKAGANTGSTQPLVLLHGPTESFVLTGEKQLSQLINKMRILSNRMEMVMAIQESDLSAILRLSRIAGGSSLPLSWPTPTVYVSGKTTTPAHPADLTFNRTWDSNRKFLFAGH